MTDFVKIVRLGTLPRNHPANDGVRMSVFCKIAFKAGRLSITGVEGPLASGNALGGCGQIVGRIAEAPAGLWNWAPGWTALLANRFLTVWNFWHLNDMRAGSPRQQAFLATHPQPDYDKALAALEAAGLSPDAEYPHNGKPYSYGSAWLTETVPDEVLGFLRSLPDADREPAWV